MKKNFKIKFNKNTRYHLKTFHDTATVHYIRSSQMFHFTLIPAPALFLVSKTDPVGAESSNNRVRECYVSKNIPVSVCFFSKNY